MLVEKVVDGWTLQILEAIAWLIKYCAKFMSQNLVINNLSPNLALIL